MSDNFLDRKTISTKGNVLIDEDIFDSTILNFDNSIEELQDKKMKISEHYAYVENTGDRLFHEMDESVLYCYDWLQYLNEELIQMSDQLRVFKESMIRVDSEMSSQIGMKPSTNISTEQ